MRFKSFSVVCNLSVGLNSKCDESTDKLRKQHLDNSSDLFIVESDGKIVASLHLNENFIEHVAVKVDCYEIMNMLLSNYN